MSIKGKNINYFLMDGVPSGRIKCTIANWTGVAYRIPRTELDKCKDRSDLAQSGVYFLFGVSDETGEGVVYIGQADVRKNGNGILGRLQEHRRSVDKDYWTEAVVFTTSNNFLSATEISWLESHFCQLAVKANRYEVKNGNEPSPGKPKEETISELEEFAETARIVMGVLGHKLFEPKAPVVNATPISDESDDLVFYCRRSGLEARGKLTNDGFVIFAGSRVALSFADYLTKGYKELRKKNAALIDDAGILREDVICNSPSAASAFVIGKNSNGLMEWKTENGKTLKEIEADSV